MLIRIVNSFRKKNETASCSNWSFFCVVFLSSPFFSKRIESFFVLIYLARLYSFFFAVKFFRFLFIRIQTGYFVQKRDWKWYLTCLMCLRFCATYFSRKHVLWENRTYRIYAHATAQRHPFSLKSFHFFFTPFILLYPRYLPNTIDVDIRRDDNENVLMRKTFRVIKKNISKCSTYSAIKAKCRLLFFFFFPRT